MHVSYVIRLSRLKKKEKRKKETIRLTEGHITEIVEILCTVVGSVDHVRRRLCIGHVDHVERQLQLGLCVVAISKKAKRFVIV